MEGKKISVNPRMIKRDIIRHWPIWVMASIWYMLFVCFVNAASRYSFSMIDADKKISEKIMISLTENTAFLSYFLGLAIAIAAFGFLGKKRNDSFFESLPFNRISLFVNRYIFGFVMWLTPCLFIFVVEIFQSLVLGSVMFTDLLEWLISAIIMYLFWYSLGVLFTVLCGRVVMAGVCYFGFTVAGIVLSFGLNCMNMLCFIGYSSGTGFIGTPLGILSPIEYIFSLGMGYRYIDGNNYIGVFNSGSPEKIFVVLLTGILLTVFACFLFNRRKPERTGDNIVFPTMKVVFSYVLSVVTAVTLTFMLTLIIIYTNDHIAHREKDRIAIIIILCVVGFITFLGSVMWVERKLKIFTKKNMLKALIFTTILAVSGICYMHDVFNIEGYVPKAENVKYINIPNSYGFFGEGRKSLTAKDEEVIEKMTEFHKIILDNMDELESFYDDTDRAYYMNGEWTGEYYISLNYRMKNDLSISRNYVIAEGSNLDNKLKAFIYENKDIFDKSLLRADQVDYDYFD